RRPARWRPAVIGRAGRPRCRGGHATDSRRIRFMTAYDSGIITFLILLAAASAALPDRAAGQQSADSTGEIVGTVRDSATSSPLPAARVRLLETHREELAHEDGS